MIIRKITLPLVVVLLISIGSFAWSAVPSLASLQDPAAIAYRDAYNLILDEQWESAVSALDAVVRNHSRSDWADDAAFWHCYAIERSQTAETAFKCYEDFLDSDYADDWETDAERNIVRLAHGLAREGKAQYEEKVRSFDDRGDEEILITTLAVLADMGDERAIEIILQHLNQAEDAYIRAEIVDMLDDYMDDNQVASRIRDLAQNDPSIEVRLAAIGAVRDVSEDEAFDLLEQIIRSDADIEFRAEALQEIGDFENERAFSLLRDLALNSDETEIRVAALEAMEDLEMESVFEVIVEIYRSTDLEEVKVAALYSISDGEYEEVKSLDFLKTVVFSEDGEVRHAAIHAIEDYESPAALEVLKTVAVSDLDIETRSQAMRAIGDFESPEAVSLLFHLLENANEVTLRRNIVQALGDTEQEQAVGILMDIARSDPNLEVRREAIEALGEIGSESARQALITLLQEGVSS